MQGDMHILGPLASDQALDMAKEIDTVPSPYFYKVWDTRQMEALQAKHLFIYCSLYICFTTKLLDKLHSQYFFLQALHSKVP
jgi:hypothetical protein